MNIVYAVIAILVALVLVLVGVTRVGTWLIDRRNPPVGAFVEVAGARIHHVLTEAPAAAELPDVVVIHGASANLKDQMEPLRPLLEGRSRVLFWDRPGHGWSTRGTGNDTPEAQAALLAALMDRVGMERAVVVAHSFGASIAVAFALAYSERAQGIVFVAPATHPWPGGASSWYYSLTTKPVIGWLFSETVALPAGWQRMQAATECVFAPNATPDDYLARASIPLVLRPATFRANATDVESLYPFAVANQKRYHEITAPAVIITGDSDTVVYEEIHSQGLQRDIAGAELVWIHNLGHKPDWIASDLVVAAVEKIAGAPRDLQALGREVEQRLSGDRFGFETCKVAVVSGDAAP